VPELKRPARSATTATTIRRAVVLSAALAVSTAITGSSAFGAANSITVGSPQPELAPFGVGAGGGGPGSGAVLPDGTLVLASLSGTGTTTVVCTMAPGARRCASSATLTAYVGHGSQDSFSGVPEVVSTGGSDVSVVLEDCCTDPVFAGVGGAVVFESTNDGRTFTGEIPAGSIQGVDAATYVAGEVVVASSETTSLNVQALPAAPHVVLSAPAHPNTRGDGDTALSTYEGGVLVASDDTHGNTLVEFAPRGANLNLTSSYGRPVGVFDGEDLAGISANALLTYSSTSEPGAFLRFFNNKSFGTPYLVPEPAGGGERYWSVEVTGSLVHVFFADSTEGSEVYTETTRNGLRWSQLVAYNPASAGALVPVLGTSGTGVVFETRVGTPPPAAQPVLNYQSVVIRLARLRAPEGKRTTLTGQAVPALSGQVVTLERRISAGQWSNISVTHESAAGTFSFTVPGVTDIYRVSVAYEPGYYLFGYSKAVTLTAVVPPKSKSKS
jgi:hypothetical protein